MLPEFELLKPASLGEALELLARYATDARPVAGGTNVIVELRDHFAGLSQRLPSVLVDIGRLPELHGIGMGRDGAWISVGGAVTIAELLRHPLIAEHGQPLKQAAAVFASPLVRNRATIGGNLVDASPAADTAPPLLALDAEVELTSREGSRCVPLHQFITGVRKTLRRPDELLTRVLWPVSTRGGAAFHKFGLRRADAISVISAAVALEPNGSGLRRASIALGAVAPRPIRVPEAEALLCEHAWSAEVIAEAAHLAAQHTSPIDDIRGSAAYRRHITEVIVRRLLSQVGSACGIAPRGLPGGELQ
jgi:carbon-monoxide dehydrogenase medium subunit